VPLKDNPSDIGSSGAFQDPHIVPSPIVVENLENTSVPQQQQTINEDIPLINSTSTDAFIELEANLQATAATTQTVDEGTAQQMIVTAPPQEIVVSHIDVSKNSFSMPLNNVTDDVIRNELEVIHEHESILSPVTDKTLDVSGIVVASDAHVDPTLQKEVDFMNNWMAQAAAIDTPFIPVNTKKKKGTTNSKASYQTRSSGPLPTSK